MSNGVYEVKVLCLGVVGVSSCGVCFIIEIRYVLAPSFSTLLPSFHLTKKQKEEQGAGKEARDEDGETPLHFAAHEGHLPVVQYLCEQGADKEARDDDGRAPLDLIF